MWQPNGRLYHEIVIRLAHLWRDERGFIGTTAAIIAASVAAAGSSVASSVIGSKAANKAGKTQAAAEEKALALQRQMYQEAQPRYAPYQQMGQNALPTLAALAGNVQAPRYGQNLADLSLYGAPPQNMAPRPAAGPGMGLPGGPAPQPPQPQPGGTVMMRAPNGAQQAVPREQVAHFQQKGATVVN